MKIASIEKINLYETNLKFIERLESIVVNSDEKELQKSLVKQKFNLIKHFIKFSQRSSTKSNSSS